MKRISRIVSVFLIAIMMATCIGAVTTANVSAATASQETTKVTTKTTTKTTTKKVKMKAKAKKSKTQTKKQTKTTTKTTTSSLKKVVTKTTKLTTTKTTLKKKSKIKTIKTTVKTTVKTTTTTKNTNTSSTNASSTSSGTTESVKTPSIDEIRKAVPSNLLNAFDQLKFTITINSSVSYDGVFSTKNHHIELKKADADVLLHEMGHFLSALKCNADDTEEFKAIYKKEKANYQGSNKTYVISTNSEYFAESYKDYVKDPNALKKSRPETYAYVKNMAESITQADIDQAYNRYSWAW